MHGNPSLPSLPAMKDLSLTSVLVILCHTLLQLGCFKLLTHSPAALLDLLGRFRSTHHHHLCSLLPVVEPEGQERGGRRREDYAGQAAEYVQCCQNPVTPSTLV